MRAESIDAQVDELVQSLKLPANWEESVRRICQQQDHEPDPEAERKEIRNTIRLIRDNYERGLYEGEEYVYWQKVNALKEKLDLLNRIPETAIEKAARTLLDLRESWEWATKEERRDLVPIMIQEVGIDIAVKGILWMKARPDYEPLFSILDGMRQDADRRFWMERLEALEDHCGIEEETEQVSTAVEIVLQTSQGVAKLVDQGNPLCAQGKQDNAAYRVDTGCSSRRTSARHIPAHRDNARNISMTWPTEPGSDATA